VLALLQPPGFVQRTQQALLGALHDFVQGHVLATPRSTAA
jgi:hypothetical protein